MSTPGESHLTAFHPFISKATQGALLWVELAACIGFVAFRTFIQFKHNKTLFGNDWIIFFALVCHIGSAITSQIMIPPMYELEELKHVLAEGGIPSSSAAASAVLYLKCQFAVLITFWTTLWAVKFSLLFFFWRLFDSLRTRIRIFWYVMCFITASTFTTTIFLQLFACRSPANFFKFGDEGCHTTRDLYLSNLVFLFSAGTDIAGDVFLLLIPFPLLWKLQVNQRQKMILALIFCLPIIPIVFGVLRLVFCNPVTGTVDVIKFTFYSMLENTAAIITACLPSMRLFFVNRSGNTTAGAGSGAQKYGNNFGSKYNKKPSTFGSTYEDHKGAIPLGSVAEIRGGEIDEEDSHSTESKRYILQKGVMVTREYSVRPDTANEPSFGRAL